MQDDVILSDIGDKGRAHIRKDTRIITPSESGLALENLSFSGEIDPNGSNQIFEFGIEDTHLIFSQPVAVTVDSTLPE